MNVPNKTSRILIYLAIVFLPIIDLLLNFGLKEVNLIPLSNDLSFKVYNEDEDFIESTKSIINSRITKNNDLSIEYKMRGNSISNYAGLFFYKNDTIGSPYLNLNRINKVSIKLKTKSGKRIPIFILSDYLINKSGKDTIVSRPFEAFIEYSPKKNKYTFDINDFKTPNWWFAEYGVSEAEIGDINQNKISSINIENCKIIPTHITDQLNITEFKLYTDNKKLLIRDLIYSLIAFPLTFYIFAILKKRKVYVAYKPTTLKENESKSNGLNIIDFLSANYMNPELTLEWASKELSIPTQELSKAIKEKYQLSFKQYLNKLRLTEVKRLLEESDLSISEIAYQSGYKNISHFNRIFKTETSVSPKEYRQNLN